MFDVGFSELVLIGIVALLVLGPERLPKVARAAGLWAGRARRFLATVKADIDREIKAEELKQIMQKQAQSSGIHEILEQTRTAVDELKSAATETVTSAQEATGLPPAGAGASVPATDSSGAHVEQTAVGDTQSAAAEAVSPATEAASPASVDSAVPATDKPSAPLSAPPPHDK